MKKGNKHIHMAAAAAIILSTACLSAGCKTYTPIELQAESDTAKEELSNKKDSVDAEEPDTKEETQAQHTENKKDMTDQPNASSGKTDLYDSVLAQYSDMVQNDFYTSLRDSDAYDSSFGEDIGLEIRTHKQDVYYTFYDIDKNGTMELIIAGGEHFPWNYDLYSYDGTRVVSVFPEMEFGYRTNFSLYENGVIEVFYSGSAAESGVDFYRIGNDGFTPELLDSFLSVGHLEEDKPVFSYSKNGNEITEEEYNAGIQSYEVALTTELDWIRIQ